MERTALVTGCSTGIGRATARRFREAGWEVYATAQDADEIGDLREAGRRTVELGVTDDAAVRAAVDRAYDERGRLDCLVNNAGYGQFGPVEDVPMDRVVEQFDVNAFGPLRFVRAALPRMRDHGGTVINVTAGVGNLTLPGIGVYNGSKYALESITDALRQEVTAEGVDVVAVEPGFVATDFYDRALAELDSLARSPAYADRYRVLDRIGVVEWGSLGINDPDRVAGAIHSAAVADSPDAVYRVGPVAVGLTYLGQPLRGRLRGRVTRAGVALLASDLGQRLLDRLEGGAAERRERPERREGSEARDPGAGRE